MRARTASRRTREHGASLMILIGVLAVLAILAGALVPNTVRQLSEASAQEEERKLVALAHGLRDSIARTQFIPGTNEWVGAIAAQLHLDSNQVWQVYPQFPSELTTRRVYLIDPAFTPGTGASRLPYTQTVGGIDVNSTNAPGTNSRVMIISSTHRGLALPVSDGIPTAAVFSNLWEWSYDPTTKAPPSGFPSAWSGQAQHLHVARLNLANQFQRISLKNLNYALNDSIPLTSVSTQVQKHFLHGSLLEVYRTTGPLYASRVVNKDASFDLTPASLEPLLCYRFSETSGTTATNSGSVGAAGNGTFVNGPLLNQAGPRPPTFPGFSAGNTAVSFDGNNDYMNTSSPIPTNLTAFTLAGWICLRSDMRPHEGIFGQNDCVWVESKNKNFINCQTYGGGSLTVSWTYATGEWHHLAMIGDGTAVRAYLDGSLADTQTQSTSNYGNPSSVNSFQVGALQADGSDSSHMVLDEVVFYDRALNTTELAQLVSGAVP